ncbi:MAG: hypothetical protein R3220_09680 [Balneolaceae bacterium]|nr:hypothetical protein [Balneolaceae bacterium]
MKTAGTSIEVFLSQHCGEDDIVTPIWPHVEPHRARNYEGYWNPLPEIFENNGRSIKSTIGNLWRKKKFYNHITALKVKQRIPGKIWDTYFKFCVERNPWDKTLSHFFMRKDRRGGNLSLDEYLEEKNFCVNYWKYCDPSGRILVDKVIRYESLMDELGQVFRDLGVPFDGTLGVRAKSSHRKSKKPYREVFSARQKEIIEKAFRKEIEMHGYAF